MHYGFLSYFIAIAQVEQWMEQLHNRRRLLDVTWQRRKLNLEKYRTLAILKCDLELLESLLRERYELLSRSRDELGDSSASAELLLQEHKKLIPEATVICVECSVGGESKKKSYVVRKYTVDKMTLYFEKLFIKNWHMKYL